MESGWMVSTWNLIFRRPCGKYYTVTREFHGRNCIECDEHVKAFIVSLKEATLVSKSLVSCNCSLEDLDAPYEGYTDPIYGG
jgi:hypothetical protein